MLPQMNAKFAAFIEPAREYRGGLLFFGAICFLLLVYTQLTFVALGAASAVLALSSGLNLSDAWFTIASSLTDPATPVSMIILLTTFIAMFAAVWLATYLFRDQSLRSLIGPGAPIRNFAITCAIVAPFVLIGFGWTLASGEVSANLSPQVWLGWMLIALPLLLLQVSAEELVFRGYLLQEFAARSNNRLVWFLLPSIIFGCLHLDPDRFGPNAILVVVGTTLFGLMAADLTIRTGNLGAAIGLHLMNNFMAMMLVSLDGTLNGLSLYVTNTHVSDQPAVRGLLMLDIATIAGVYILYLLVMRWREWR